MIHKRVSVLLVVRVHKIVSNTLSGVYRVGNVPLKQRGITDRLHVRAPLPELDEFTRQDIDTMVEDLKALFP